MYKVKYNLFDVHPSFKVGIDLVIIEDEVPNKINYKAVHQYSYNGNEYMKINYRPYVTIDIRSRMVLDRQEQWNANMIISLNRRDLFNITLAFKELYRNMINDKELFYYRQDAEGYRELKLNPEKASLYEKSITVSGNKRLKIQHCVVEPRDEFQPSYEGIVIFINSSDYYTNLTYDELLYVIDEFSKINLDSLGLQIATFALTYRENNKDEEVKELVFDPVPEIKDERLNESGNVFTVPTKNTGIFDGLN